MHRLQYEVDQAHLPGPHQKVVVVPLPDLGDPAFHLDENMKHFVLDLTGNRRSLNRLVFAAVNEVSFNAEILNDAGDVVVTGAQLNDGLHSTVAIETANLEPGTYFLRLAPASDAAQAAGAKLNVARLPSLSVRV